MKNIKNFILEKLKVTPNARQYDLPTWEQFVDALYHFPGKVVNLSNFSEELENAEVLHDEVWDKTEMEDALLAFLK